MNEAQNTPLYTVTLDGVNPDPVTADMIEDWATDIFIDNEYWEYELEFDNDQVTVYAYLIGDLEAMLDEDQELGTAWVKIHNELFYLVIAELIEDEDED